MSRADEKVGMGASIYAPGDLNPNAKQDPTAKRLDIYKTEPIELLKKISKDFFKPDLLKDHGSTYHAQVLRVTKPPVTSVKPGSVFAVIKTRTDIPFPTDLIELVARIPELHSHLPFPSELGEIPGPHQKIIDMHPTFYGYVGNSAIPKVGDVVRVNVNTDTYEAVITESPGVSAGLFTSLVAAFGKGKKEIVGESGGNFVPTQTFQVNKGTALGALTESGPSFKKGERIKKQTTLFVCHETAGVGTAKRSATRAAERGSGVHFWCGRDGRVLQQAKVEQRLPHANWSNYLSVGIEVSNLVWIRAGQVAKWENMGFVVVGPNAGASGLLGREGLKTEHGIGSRGTNYTLPTEIQCRKTWEIIQSLSTNPPHESIRIPIKFPAAPGGKFIWGRYAGDEKRAPGDYVNGTKTGATTNWWKGAKNAHHGITSHSRWAHSDGLFIEYYCLGRASIYRNNSEGAYFAAIGALLQPEINKGVLRWPNREYERAGRRAYGDLPLNPAVRGMDFSASLEYVSGVQYA